MRELAENVKKRGRARLAAEQSTASYRPSSSAKNSRNALHQLTASPQRRSPTPSAFLVNRLRHLFKNPTVAL